MKCCTYIIIMISLFTSCKSGDSEDKAVKTGYTDTANFTNILWADSLMNIGTVEPDTKTEIQFKFKNTGSKPLVIVSAKPGCGCTVADYPKEPVAPGGSGVITAEYKAGSTAGEFRKNIYITTNTPGSEGHYLYFFGTIKNRKESVSLPKLDTLKLTKRITNELKKNLLLKPTKI